MHNSIDVLCQGRKSLVERPIQNLSSKAHGTIGLRLSPEKARSVLSVREACPMATTGRQRQIIAIAGKHQRTNRWVRKVAADTNTLQWLILHLPFLTLGTGLVRLLVPDPTLRLQNHQSGVRNRF